MFILILLFCCSGIGNYLESEFWKKNKHIEQRKKIDAKREKIYQKQSMANVGEKIFLDQMKDF